MGISTLHPSEIPTAVPRLADHTGDFNAGSVPILTAPVPDDVEDAVDEAVAVTFDALQLVLGTVLGAGLGIVAGMLILGISRFWARRHPTFQPVHDAIFRPVEVLLTVIGGWIGYSLSENRISPEVAPQWLAYIDQFFLVLVILVGTWLAASVINGLVNALYLRMKESSEEQAARVETQVQILHRVIIVVVWILGVAGVLLTFPEARAAGASVLASAGLISVVAGLAAQTTLGNVFAGLQLAFSDSIRVGDIVFYEGTMATVEEITLTYVVLAVWDGRRIIVPSTKMTTEPFENWTRRVPDMSGSVEWVVDWAIPIDAARKHMLYLLRSSDLWDGNLGVLQVADASNGFITLRGLVSAKDSSTLTDLKNYLREAMVIWIQREAPQAVPHERRYENPTLDFNAAYRKTEERVEARLGEEPPHFEPEPEEPLTPHIAAESDLERTTVISPRELAEFARTPIAERDTNLTITMDPISEILPSRTGGHESSLFTGSPEAEKRAEVYSGPGEKAYEERRRKLDEQNTADMKAVDASSDGATTSDSVDEPETEATAVVDTSDNRKKD